MFDREISRLPSQHTVIGYIMYSLVGFNTLFTNSCSAEHRE